MSTYEIEGKIRERILKLYEEGALEARLDIKTKATNEDMRKVTDILTKGKIEDFWISKGVLHPMKDVGPTKHEDRIAVRIFASAFKIDEIVEQLGKIAETEILALGAGTFLQKEVDAIRYFIYKEEEP